MKFVYTGSLLIGRDRTMTIVADAINEINKDRIRAELYIYSQTSPSSTMVKKLNRGSSKFCGQVSRDEVQRIQQDADVVIFAEALDGKEAYAAKLSFSTKITDYLSNGKCILAIGKSDIAPIDYFRKNHAAVIANNAAEIYIRLSEIVSKPAMINQLGQQAFKCAIRNHDAGMISERFINTICKAIPCNYEKDLHYHDN